MHHDSLECAKILYVIEFETSIEIFSRVLHHYNVPINVIDKHIESIRQSSYRSLRRSDIPWKQLANSCEFLEGIETAKYLLRKGSPAEVRSLNDLRIRPVTGPTIIFVQRKDVVHSTPAADFVLRDGDIVLLIGSRESIRWTINYLGSHRQDQQK